MADVPKAQSKSIAIFEDKAEEGPGLKQRSSKVSAEPTALATRSRTKLRKIENIGGQPRRRKASAKVSPAASGANTSRGTESTAATSKDAPAESQRSVGGKSSSSDSANSQAVLDEITRPATELEEALAVIEELKGAVVALSAENETLRTRCVTLEDELARVYQAQSEHAYSTLMGRVDNLDQEETQTED